MYNIFNKLKPAKEPSPSDHDRGAIVTNEGYLKDLNKKQLEAVESTEGYVRVIAGAGSGKTRTLTSRVAYLIDKVGIAPENILCVTFTNKAANEMKKRVEGFLGDRSTGALIMTFGALEARIIREDGNVIGYPRNYQIIDEEDSKRLLANIINETKNELGHRAYIDDNIKVKRLKKEYTDAGKLYPNMLRSNLSHIEKQLALRRSEVSEGADSKALIVYMLTRYVYEKRKSFACDFHDLPYLCIWILESSTSALEKWQDKLRYIMVDEFQDVSVGEYYIIRMLQEKYKNLFIVGDPDQTIYTFRGSKIELFLGFNQTYKGTKDIYLVDNYRSGSKILDASNTLVRKNLSRLDKDLLSVKSEVGQVSYFHAKSVYEEADFVAHNIKRFSEQGMSYDDIAILYRAHHVTRVIEESLLRENIPYKVYSGIGFYQRKEIKDVLAYMRLLISGDDISFSRVINEPSRQVGPKTRREIEAYALNKNLSHLDAFIELTKTQNSLFQHVKKQEFAKFIYNFRKSHDEIITPDHPLSNLLMFILRETGYEEYLRVGGDEERLDNLSEFKQSLVDYEESLVGESISAEDYLQQITLLTNQDTDDKVARVKLMTVHTAKGMEFPVVFVVALNEGIFPSSKIKKEPELEEERRLAYVAYTRAENVLILSDAEGTNFNGTKRYPSRFIFDAGNISVDYLVELDPELIESYGKYPSLEDHHETQAGAELKAGDLVTHGVFKTGKIIDVQEDFAVVKFDSKEHELRVRSDTLSRASIS